VLRTSLKRSSAVINQNGTLNGTRQYYFPFGGNRGGAFSTLTTKRFTGQYHESSLPGGEGLSYYNARWYDAKLGRFLSADSLVPGPGNPQAFNRYAYVFNNPLLFIDPSGHLPCVGVKQCIRDPDNPYYAGNAKGGTSPSVYPAIKGCGVYDFSCIGRTANKFYRSHANYNATLDPYFGADSRYDFAVAELANYYQRKGDSHRAWQSFWLKPGIKESMAADISTGAPYALGTLGAAGMAGAIRWLPGATAASRALGTKLAGISKGHYEILRQAGISPGGVTTAVTEVNGYLYVAVYGNRNAAQVIENAMGSRGRVVSYGQVNHAERQLYDWLTTNQIEFEAIGVSNYKGPCPGAGGCWNFFTSEAHYYNVYWDKTFR
jgi:RHS repeat-associated protein